MDPQDEQIIISTTTVVANEPTQQQHQQQLQTGTNYYRNLSLDQQQQQQQQAKETDCKRAQVRLSAHEPAQPLEGAHRPLVNNRRGNLQRTGSSQDQEEEEDEQSNKTTDGQTMMHILKANIGTGVLAMPLAFKNVGLWLGLGLVPIIGIICIHCMNILISSHNQLCDRFNYESLDYDQVAALGLACGPKWTRRLAKRASIIVTIFLMLTQIGFCCVYILFTVENLQVACANLFGLNYSMTTYLLLIFPIIGLTSCTSNLKYLARISTLANMLQLTGLALIFFDLLQFHTYALVAGDGPWEGGAQSAPLVQPHIVVEQGITSNIMNGLPLFFATAVYAFEGIGVVLPLVKEMQRPEHIQGRHGVLNTSMSCVALLYMAIGFFGYAKYGQTVAGSITLNLPERTLNEIVRLAFALAIGLSYSLQFYVPWTIVWPVIDEGLFYSYRPRVPRDKLSILDKLSAENHWALNKVLEEEAELARSQAHQNLNQQQQQQQQRQQQQQQQQDQLAQGTTPAANYTQQSQPAAAHYNDNSMATTLASSYSISLSTAPHHQQQQQQQQQRLFQSNQKSAATTRIRSGQYGTLAGAERARRNRLDDVMEQSSSDEMPEVQWRPPPRSMRGKRKLVRYTVILLTVSFTFVAAALIPRLDLFISLIGALASSSLAIIFPAIIQLCTFWSDRGDADDRHDGNESSSPEAEQQTNEEGSPTSASNKCCCRHNRPASSKSGSAQQLFLLANCRDCKRRRRRQWRKSVLWHLFVVKNMFLVLFGVLGLITGTWVSLQQLGATSAQV